jgi:hypothetical protein
MTSVTANVCYSMQIDISANPDDTPAKHNLVIKFSQNVYVMKYFYRERARKVRTHDEGRLRTRSD